MNKSYKRYEFKTFQGLEKFFIKKILPKKNIHSKVIGKVLLVWKKMEIPVSIKKDSKLNKKRKDA